MRTAEEIKEEIKELEKELSYQNCVDWIDMLEEDIKERKAELAKING